MPSSTYQLFREAILREKQVTCVYQRKYREVCPHIIGHTDGKERVFVFQFAGESTGALPNWRCFHLSEVGDVRLRDGDWRAGESHKKGQTCVHNIDLDINVHVRKLRKLP